MDDEDYRGEILWAYLGELGGAATAAALAARPDFSPEQRRKSEAFGRMERHVARLLEPVLERLEVKVGDTSEIETAARTRAAAITDWAMLVTAFGERLQPYIRRFDRLRENAAPPDVSALTALADHEYALAAFGRAEAAGDGEDSLRHLTGFPP